VSIARLEEQDEEIKADAIADDVTPGADNTPDGPVEE
jgi:hypothetical protein